MLVQNLHLSEFGVGVTQFIALLLLLHQLIIQLYVTLRLQLGSTLPPPLLYLEPK